MNVNDKVKVITVHDSEQPSDDDVDEPEYNYWKLINCLGTIKEIRACHSYYPEKGEQALVQFDISVMDLGLIAHNEIPNSLWFFTTDLKKV